jgi:hypothetical protein
MVRGAENPDTEAVSKYVWPWTRLPASLKGGRLFGFTLHLIDGTTYRSGKERSSSCGVAREILYICWSPTDSLQTHRGVSQRVMTVDWGDARPDAV